MIKPRRPYIDEEPDGYEESDNCWIVNNMPEIISRMETETGQHPAPRKTYDITDGHVYIRYTDRVMHINSRNLIRKAWLWFDEFVSQNISEVREMGYNLRDGYTGAWFTVMNGKGFQQWNAEPIKPDDLGEFVQDLKDAGYKPW